MMKAKPLPSPDLLRSILSYDSETGIFRWLVHRGGTAKVGSIAGTINKAGYRIIRIGCTADYLAHRLAWFMVTGKEPPDHIDHRDMDKANNRWANLRAATKSDNARNRPAPRHNTSGIKGVYWAKRERKWCAQIQGDGKRHISLGYYDRIEDAAAAYEAGARRHHKEFARVA